MANVNFNIKEIELYKKNLERFIKDQDKISETIVKDIALRMVSDIIENTPVDTGTLRMGWLVQSEEIAEARRNETITQEMIKNNLSVETEGKYYIVKVTNVVSYAQAVEYGHRQVNRSGITTGWKDGVFMMTIAEGKIEAAAAKIAEYNIKKIARAYGL